MCCKFEHVVGWEGSMSYRTYLLGRCSDGFVDVMLTKHLLHRPNREDIATTSHRQHRRHIRSTKS